MPSPKLPRLPGWFSPYRIFIRPWAFRIDAETVHHFVLSMVRMLWEFALGRKLTRVIYSRRLPRVAVKMGNMEFRNPIGLAAGFDKNAAILGGLETLGFGFVEIGTVTPRPQLGNPRPRLQRIPEKRAILNRMGFNNDGAEIISAQLKRLRAQGLLHVPVGVNIGKNRDTPNAMAVQDYDSLLKTFSRLADYFVVNISSPNTPGLRDLQNMDFIAQLGERVRQHRLSQPVFLKLSPDVSPDDLKSICGFCGSERFFNGLVLANTLGTDLGGLSGYPLKGPSTMVLKIARSLLPKEALVISVGGIETPEDVIERFKMGANAVQVYSTLIYQGPGAVRRLVKGLHRRMKKAGIKDLSTLREI